MRYVNYIGLDLGQAADFTALTLLESPVWVDGDKIYDLRWHGHTAQAGWNNPNNLPADFIKRLPMSRQHEPTILQGRLIERYPRRTSYTAIVQDVALLMNEIAHPELTALIIDRTGCGRPVFDMFTSAGLKCDCFGITITGGDEVHQENGDHFKVPKRDLVGAAQQMLQHERVKFAEALPDWATLQDELRSFAMKINIRTGHDTYEAWREGQHDDLVLSFAMAAWFYLWLDAHTRPGFSIDYTGGHFRKQAQARANFDLRAVREARRRR